jgi:hypothetical protein
MRGYGKTGTPETSAAKCRADQIPRGRDQILESYQSGIF